MIDAWAVLISKVVEQHIDPAHHAFHVLFKWVSAPVVLGVVAWAFRRKIEEWWVRHVMHKEHSK